MIFVEVLAFFWRKFYTYFLLSSNHIATSTGTSSFLHPNLLKGPLVASVETPQLGCCSFSLSVSIGVTFQVSNEKEPPWLFSV